MAHPGVPCGEKQESEELNEQHKPPSTTQNSEARAVLLDVAKYEEAQEAQALLKILSLGDKQIEGGKVKPVADVVQRLRVQITTKSSST